MTEQEKDQWALVIHGAIDIGHQSKAREMIGHIAATERAAERNSIVKMLAEPKETTHRRFYDAFHAWFMQGGCDFWSECDAPEELATIAVELYDKGLAKIIAEE